MQASAHTKADSKPPSKDKNIWTEIGKKINISAYPHNYAIQKQIRWYMAHQEALLELTQNAQPYIYYVTQQVESHGLPLELALLPMIESDYKPNSLSNASALGLWQFMPATARDLGIRINGWYDGRKDVVASTHAALAYLEYLHDYFHSWPLAFAAYNAGVGTVIKAINYNKARHRQTDYWSLPLPQETKDYVPKLLAIATIIAHPKIYKLPIHTVKNAAYFNQVKLNSPMPLTTVAELSDVDLKTLRQLNPAFKQANLTPKQNYTVLIPTTKSKSFTIELAQYNKKRAKHPVYLVKAGDSLHKIAAQYHIAVTALYRYNGLSSDNIKVGQALYIPSTKPA